MNNPTNPTNPGTPGAPPDVDQLIRHTTGRLYRHIATRLALAVVLLAVPFVATAAGYDAALPFFCIPAGLFVLIFLVLRLRHGSRLGVCKKVLRAYPLEYRTRVSKKASQWQYLGDVHTVRVSVRGQQGAPTLRALNAATVRRWPKGAEEAGAWFAGDAAFGGVLVLPAGGEIFFVQPAEWEKSAAERDAADPQRRSLAEQTGISRLLEREPNLIAALGR
ncbi:hypothetical protein [Streptomyces sp. NBC_01304]|uniref:hypothetical protein n=1 Tax=Streptomyces sp. NBC_01304 TaxID=2903818 RepID=UPI002E119610|nr:hypothetical protein OG430_20190 [Streptomyces sp. NBC_01304]